MASREAVAQALLAVVQDAYPWTTPARRKLLMWTGVPRETRPAAFLFEGDSSDTTWSNNASFKSEKNFKLLVYTDGSGEDTIGATILNNILDALETAINSQEPMTGRNTLGGLVYSCRIEGRVLAVPGDIDGDGILLVPVRVVLPQV